ncbi:alpha-amylase family glycosyl hydrolase [Pontiellaceae bacterium B12227]|nr:alpha-amylase family glycosyl hydrolase [Pontiellaceae bacterium B12227]
MSLLGLGLVLTGGVSARDWIDRAWKGDVIYFVMTDRFSDGDPENNIPEGSDPALYDAAQQNINLYHGGDFRGLENALTDGYFTDLGISAIWITPPVRNAWMSQHDLGGSKSGYHGYWTQDFRDIDPHLTSRTDLAGKPYPAGTAGRLQHYKDLIDLAHSKEIKVVQDIVCNHIGPLFYYDLDRNGAHENNIDEWQPPYLPDGTYRDAARWANEPQWNVGKPDDFFQSLELYWARGFSPDSLGKSDGEEQRCDFFSLRALNTEPEAAHFDRLVDEFVDIYHFYIDEMGVDGLRIDTVKHVHKDFWNAFTSRLRERLGPDSDKLLLFGEVYGNSIEDINYYADSLDSLLNFQFTWAVRDVLRQDNRGDVKQLARFIERMNNEVKTTGNYDAKAMRLNSVNFIGNHDGLNRFLVNGISEANHDLALATLLTFEGIPCLYYGSELAIRDDQVDRHRESETGRATLFDNQGRRTFEQRKSNPHFKMISELITLRKQLPALVDGDINVYPLNKDGVLAYRRGNALVVFNAGDQPKQFYIPATTLLYSNGIVENSKPDRPCTVPAKTLQVYRMEEKTTMQSATGGKAVIYQVFTRLFGNRNTTNKPWGTIEENGVGKFNDFTDTALEGIKEFGTTHIWYTGVPHHAVVRDYTGFGISNDDPDVVKGRAGSPYAVKDYYNVNPDLAANPAKRFEEFQALIDRTHQHGMKVIIDIVPNHVARAYYSTTRPGCDFGIHDDTDKEYQRNNNFYYIVDESFRVPEGEVPLNGEAHPLADGHFDETPAKWTGNGSRLAQPNPNDWYETVKVNYGVRPDGTHDFPALPESLRGASFKEHADFWADKEVPDSWIKFRDIALYWLDYGVDGFRFDMAEMVPVEFWSYMNSSIKMEKAKAFCLAEVYNRNLYRNYIQLGLMDALYDKVDFYDTTKRIMQGRAPASDLLPIIGSLSDIDPHMLHFLENHDEQRIACPDFAGDSVLGKPAMTVSALAGRGPTLLYFAQALGEPADRDAGYGKATRTTIFDYWGLENLKRWANDGAYDGGQLTEAEKSLRKHYTTLLSFSAENPAFNGSYQDLHRHNLAETKNYSEKLFSFARWSGGSKVVVLASFDRTQSAELQLKLPPDLIQEWQLQDGDYQLKNIFNDSPTTLTVRNGRGFIRTELNPLESQVFLLQ